MGIVLASGDVLQSSPAGRKDTGPCSRVLCRDSLMAQGFTVGATLFSGWSLRYLSDYDWEGLKVPQGREPWGLLTDGPSQGTQPSSATVLLRTLKMTGDCLSPWHLPRFLCKTF